MKYMRAYVELKLTGENVERFLNLCVFHDIVFRQLSDDGEGFRCVIAVEDFYEMKDLMKKTGVKVAVSKRYGLPFFMRRMCKKKGLLWGGGLLLLLLGFSQACLWDIDIYGTEVVTRQQLLEVIYQQQVHVGMRLSEIDYVALEEEIRSEFPEIVWCSVSREENHLQVFIREKEAAYGKSQTTREQARLLGIRRAEGEGFTDLVADKALTITSMVVRKGVSGIAGREVKEGDVLVYGLVPVFSDDGSVKGYLKENAEARITAVFQEAYSDSMERQYIKKEYTGRKAYGFIFRGKVYSLKKFREYDIEQIMSGEQGLCPLTLLCYREYNPTEYERSDEVLENILSARLQDFLNILKEKGIQIIAKDVTIYKNADRSSLQGTLTLEGTFDE